jgi:hypothetical protein
MANTKSTLSNDQRRQLCEQHKVKVVIGGWAEFYHGTKESLIAANILKDGQFPSDEGNNKISLRIVVDDNGQQEVVKGKIQLSRGLDVIRVIKSGQQFQVSIPYSKEVLDRQSKIDKYENALKEERRKLAGLSSNKDQARNKHIGFMQSVNEAFLGILESGVHGYHYDKSVIETYKDHCHEMWELLKNANITLNKKDRENIELEIKSEKLTIDSGFSSFMNMVVESPVNLNE